jgi:hypothetical protein
MNLHEKACKKWLSGSFALPVLKPRWNPGLQANVINSR